MVIDSISRRGIAALAAGALALAVAGCGGAPADAGSQATPSDETAAVRMASLKGPTSIGMVPLMEQAQAGELGADYDFLITGAADEIVPKVIKGDIDIALVPANVASVLYAKTKGAVQVIDINTLGVLHVVTGDPSVREFEDLAGRTVYLTGKGTTPEYAMKYLLDQSGIADKVKLEFKSQAPEVVAALAADASAVGVLPEPYKTAAIAKNDELTAPVSLTDVWDRISREDGSRLVTGVTVVRSDFAKENPQVVEEFLDAHAASAAAVSKDPAAWSQGVVDVGIVEKAPIAQKAIPGCNVVCLTGKEMRAALEGYLGVLHDADPASIGGELPDDGFYYVK